MVKELSTSLENVLKEYKGINTLVLPNNVTLEIPIIEEMQKDIKAIASRQTFNIIYLISSKGVHTIVNDRKHPRLKVIQAWVEVKDNSSRLQSIEILGITQPKEIAPSYKAGVAIPLTLRRSDEVNFYRQIKVKASGDRLVTIHILCESKEEQP